MKTIYAYRYNKSGLTKTLIKKKDNFTDVKCVENKYYKFKA